MGVISVNSQKRELSPSNNGGQASYTNCTIDIQISQSHLPRVSYMGGSVSSVSGSGETPVLNPFSGSKK